MGKQNNPTELLTKRELAEKCKCSVRTIDKWISLGMIPYLKVLRTVRFDLDQVMEALLKYEVSEK